jgi:hypothetical protein
MVAMLLGSATAFAIACGFPDVRFGEFDDVDVEAPDGEVDGGDGADGADAEMASDARTSNADAPGDDVEAGTRQDGQAKIDGSTACPGANPCDCDNDGYEAQGASCGGTDCDDFDPLIHPNQDHYIAEPPEPPNVGNWDCTDPIEKQYPFKLSCGALGGRGEGFRNDPACGVEADYYRCTGFLFGSEKIGTRRQGCR